MVFRYLPDKEGVTFRRMVEGFQGTIVLDASSTHNKALDLAGVLWAGCNAHGLRKFRDATPSDPVLAPEGERWVAAMFDKDREGRETLALTGARNLRAEAVGRSNWVYAGSPEAAENLAVG